MCDQSLFRNEPGLLPKHVEDLVKEIGKEAKIDDFQILVAPSTCKGDNVLGEISKVRITGTKDKEFAEIALVVKQSPTSKVLRESVPVNLYYSREIKAYTDTLPTLCNLQKNSEIPDEEKFKFAKFFKGITEENKETAALEDLSYTGFRMYEKIRSLDEKHLELVIKTMARFHATSFVLQRKDPNKFNELALHSAQKLEYKDMLGKVMEVTKKTLLSVIEEPENRERIGLYLEDMMDKFENFVNPKTAAPYNVLCHGDCWTSNFLFSYDMDDRLVDMRILDWQITRLASPITDIAYMMFSSTDEELRASCFERMLDIYYETLSANIVRMGCSMAECYPEEVYRDHIKKIMPYGLITSVMVLPVTLGDDDEEFNAEDESAEVDEAGFTLAFSKLCQDRLTGAARDIMTKGYI